jgi:hypothetical protein
MKTVEIKLTQDDAGATVALIETWLGFLSPRGRESAIARQLCRVADSIRTADAEQNKA